MRLKNIAERKLVRVQINLNTYFYLASGVNGRVSISAFASLVGIYISIACSDVGLEVFAINAGIKNYKSIINTSISKRQFLSVNNVLREYDDMQVAIKNMNVSTVHQDFNLSVKNCYLIVFSVEKIQKVKTQSLQRQIMEN